MYTLNRFLVIKTIMERICKKDKNDDENCHMSPLLGIQHCNIISCHSYSISFLSFPLVNQSQNKAFPQVHCFKNTHYMKCLPLSYEIYLSMCDQLNSPSPIPQSDRKTHMNMCIVFLRKAQPAPTDGTADRHSDQKLGFLDRK